MKDSGLEALLDDAQDYERLEFYNKEIVLEYSHSLHAYTVNDPVDGRCLVPGVTTVVAMIDKSGPLTQWAANETCNWIRANWNEFLGTHVLATHGMPPLMEELEPLLQQARFNYRTISKTATDIGHLAHNWLEQYIKDLIAKEDRSVYLAPEDDKAANCVEAALGWMDKHKFKPLHSERKIYSRKYNYAGTLDWIGEVHSCGNYECCPFKGSILALGDFKSSRHLYDEYRVQTAAYQAAWEEEFPDQLLGGRILMRLDKEGAGIETLTMTQEEFDSDFDGFLGTLQTYNWQKQLDLNRKFAKAVDKAEKKALKEAAKPAKTTRKPSKKAVIKGYEPIPQEKVA